MKMIMLIIIIIIIIIVMMMMMIIIVKMCFITIPVSHYEGQQPEVISKLPCHAMHPFLGRLRRVDLKTWVRCPSVGTSVRPSTKTFSDSDEIWCIGRGR